MDHIRRIVLHKGPYIISSIKSSVEQFMNRDKHKCRIDKKCRAYTYNEEQGNIECFLHQTNRRLYVDPWIIVGAKKSNLNTQGRFLIRLFL